MKKLIIIFVLALLTGCASQPVHRVGCTAPRSQRAPVVQTVDTNALAVGDVMLYAPTSFIGDLIVIAAKSGLKSHVEVYVGDGRVFAAREEGIGIYPLRIDGSLACVRRHEAWRGFDTNAAMEAVAPLIGQSYGTCGLFSFFNPWRIPQSVVRVCSPVVAIYLRAGGAECFNPDFASNKVTPGSFFQTGGLNTIWRNPVIDRQMSREYEGVLK